MSISQVQRVFIVEHYLASPSYLTCQNEFRNTFPFSPVASKSTISRLMNRFSDTGSVQDRNRSGRPSVLSCIKHEEKSASLNAVDISNA
jgi:transposase